MSQRDAGSYSCRYSIKSDLSVWSEPSDAMELVVAEGFLPKPSISVSPGGVIPVGGKVTIRCWHQRLGMRFLLYKDGDGNHPTYTDPASYVAEFPIPSARREDGGSYTCRYSHRTGPAAYSEPSDPVQIIVAVKVEGMEDILALDPKGDPDPVSAPSLMLPAGDRVCLTPHEGLGWGQLSHPQSEPGRRRQLHMLLSPRLGSRHPVGAQRPHGVGGS
ncbi:unnamed protein product, partial [Caretta caretta]